MRCQNFGRRTHNKSLVHNIRDNGSEEECRQFLEANRMRISQAKSTTALEEFMRSTSGERRQNRPVKVSITYEHLAFRYDQTVEIMLKINRSISEQ